MAKKQTKLVGSLELKEYANFIHFLDGLNEPWGIKDQGSRHIYMNQAALTFTNMPKKFDLLGKLDADFPAVWAELATDLVTHDQLAQQAARSVAAIVTHYWNGSRVLEPCITEKMLICNAQQQCIGVLWNAKKMRMFSALKYINRQQPAVLITEPNTDLFTKAELRIMFLALQRYSSKEISRRLNLSPRTVENRLNSMYQKTETHSLLQFAEYCRQQGLDNYIPYEFVVKGIFVIE